LYGFVAVPQVAHERMPDAVEVCPNLMPPGARMHFDQRVFSKSLHHAKPGAAGLTAFQVHARASGAKLAQRRVNHAARRFDHAVCQCEVGLAYGVLAELLRDE
jgi:hypothetical protein